MQRETFSALVRKYFGYLEDQYGFSVVKEEMYGPGPFDDGVIEFQSNTATITVRLDRGDIMTHICPSSEPRISNLSVDVIMDFRTNGKETNLMTFPKSYRNIQSRVEYQLAIYANQLRKYGDPFLRGDFSTWLDACKYFLNKMQEFYRSRTGEELPKSEPFSVYVKSKEDPLGSE